MYEYQVMLFELTNVSTTFQELINHVLYDYLDEFVIAYLDNILIYFDYEKSAIIDTDASEKAMRAQLQQIDNEEQKWLIACYTWKLTFTEQQYNIHDREMLAIVKALEQWKAYLQEAKHQTIIKSDHKNLQYFMMIKKLNEW